MKLLLAWAINAASLFLLPYLISAVKVPSFGTALIAALVIGLLNTFIRPVLFILTLPINILTLGLFTLVLNGITFWIASRLIGSFSIDGFWWAVLAAVVYSVISWAISSMLLSDKAS